mmetsp:Transcript_31840/g.67443  ORF Transcript_31840/g.67443 Transcript_31840/m.67443 type:complete len:107 (-) Transcript_31840:704-1024(-)
MRQKTKLYTCILCVRLLGSRALAHRKDITFLAVYMNLGMALLIEANQDPDLGKSRLCWKEDDLISVLILEHKLPLSFSETKDSVQILGEVKGRWTNEQGIDGKLWH